ncbi:hypothetical protein SAMN03097708_02353 [Thiohalomonas denitrificans]|uniref:Uncharacterized protein n=1 Tax=Thiohalomonas denitrificans TaxID=415747 RepID=A0A1G5QMI3_9GAMM|nr:hypothetical protein SAMN03097708_02353 [Thiohalomonas denitrificans]
MLEKEEYSTKLWVMAASERTRQVSETPCLWLQDVEEAEAANGLWLRLGDDRPQGRYRTASRNIVIVDNRGKGFRTGRWFATLMKLCDNFRLNYSVIRSGRMAPAKNPGENDGTGVPVAG